MARSIQKTSDEKFDAAETQRRLESILRGAFSGPPKPMKDIPRKRAKVQRRKRKISGPKSA